MVKLDSWDQIWSMYHADLPKSLFFPLLFVHPRLQTFKHNLNFFAGWRSRQYLNLSRKKTLSMGVYLRNSLCLLNFNMTICKVMMLIFAVPWKPFASGMLMIWWLEGWVLFLCLMVLGTCLELTPMIQEAILRLNMDFIDSLCAQILFLNCSTFLLLSETNAYFLTSGLREAKGARIVLLADHKRT